MIIVWSSAAFSTYLCGFQLKYIQGDIYVNVIVAQISEILAYIISGSLLYFFSIKIVLVFAFAIGACGMLALVATQTKNQILLCVFIFTAKIGIASGFNTVFIANTKLFPVGIAATTFGICNTFCRAATIITPYIAEVKPESISFWIFFAVCIFASFASMNLKMPN